jgi:hypothetical protein
VDVGLAIIQMRKCQLITIFTGILDNPILKLKFLGNKNICVHYKVTLRTFVSTLDCHADCSTVRLRWADNIKMDYKEIGWEGMASSCEHDM